MFTWVVIIVTFGVRDMCTFQMPELEKKILNAVYIWEMRQCDMDVLKPGSTNIPKV